MPTRKLGINLVVIVAVAALFTGLWALYNRPVSAPDWPEQISGFSFSPFRAGQSLMKCADRAQRRRRCGSRSQGVG